MQVLCETRAKWPWKFYLLQATYGIYLNETSHSVLFLKSDYTVVTTVFIFSRLSITLLIGKCGKQQSRQKGKAR